MNWRFIRWLIIHLIPPQPQVALHLALAYNSFFFPVTIVCFITYSFAQIEFQIQHWKLSSNPLDWILDGRMNHAFLLHGRKWTMKESLLHHFVCNQYANIFSLSQYTTSFYFIGDLIAMPFFRDLWDINLR